MSYNLISHFQCFNAELAYATMNEGFTASLLFICLLRCCNLIKKNHNNDVLPKNSSPIPHSYNPQKFGPAWSASATNT